MYALKKNEWVLVEMSNIKVDHFFKNFEVITLKCLFHCGGHDERSSRLNFEQLFEGHSKDFLNAVIS